MMLEPLIRKDITCGAFVIAEITESVFSIWSIAESPTSRLREVTLSDGRGFTIGSS